VGERIKRWQPEATIPQGIAFENSCLPLVATYTPNEKPEKQFFPTFYLLSLSFLCHHCTSPCISYEFSYLHSILANFTRNTLSQSATVSLLKDNTTAKIKIVRQPFGLS
jgi:hypothetical protein